MGIRANKTAISIPACREVIRSCLAVGHRDGPVVRILPILQCPRVSDIVAATIRVGSRLLR